MKTIDIIVKKNEEKVVPFIWMNGSASSPQVDLDHDNEFTINAKLVGEGANLLLLGIFVGTNNSSVVFNTNVTHAAKNTKSMTEIRGVFQDRSSFSNDGMVYIKKGAKQADGYFRSKILLFDDAKGRSVPSLEIDDNEIKAGHASTVGKPDENQLLYLRSRGIPEKIAEQLLVSGFFEPVIMKLPQEEQKKVKEKIAKTI